MRENRAALDLTPNASRSRRVGTRLPAATQPGLAEIWPSVGVFVFYICSAGAVILALRRLELSIAYAIWSGVGMALTAMIGIIYFREPLTALKLALDRARGSSVWAP
jgi:multidrug transporter EmrE-like cation transporter